MELITLGTGSAIPTSDRKLPATALVRDGEVFLFDCGEGTQMQMMKAGLKHSKVKYIFISHLHGDHIYGLMGLISTIHLTGRRTDLNLYGPQRLGEYVQFMQRLTDMHPEFEIHVHEMEESTRGGVVCETPEYTISALPLEHRIFTLGYRFQEKDKPGRLNIDRARELGIPEGPLLGKLKAGEPVELTDGRVIHPSCVVGPKIPGRSFAYCTDTRFTRNAVELAHEATLLLHDATFTAELNEKAIEAGHSTSEDAARVAREANVKQLVISHISARHKEAERLLAECEAIFPNTMLAYDLRRIMIGDDIQSDENVAAS